MNRRTVVDVHRMSGTSATVFRALSEVVFERWAVQPPTKTTCMNTTRAGKVWAAVEKMIIVGGDWNELGALGTVDRH